MSLQSSTISRNHEKAPSRHHQQHSTRPGNGIFATFRSLNLLQIGKQLHFLSVRNHAVLPPPPTRQTSSSALGLQNYRLTQTTDTEAITAENDFYGATCKLSPTAPEQRYGIAGEVLQHCCSNTPGLLEKVYGCVPHFRKTPAAEPNSLTGRKNAHKRCGILAYLAAKTHLPVNNRVLRNPL